MAPSTVSKQPQSQEPATYFQKNKYTWWRRSILLGIVLSIYLGVTKGAAYAAGPAAITFWSFVHIFDSVARKPDGVFARFFLVVTNLQKVIDIEDFILAPIRPRPVARV